MAPDSAALAALDPVGMVAPALMAPRVLIALDLAALTLPALMARDLTAPDPAALDLTGMAPRVPVVTAAPVLVDP